jgi:hypothetical protein
VKAEIVAFWGDWVSPGRESERLAEVIQAESGSGARMQTPCRQAHVYCYCDGTGWDRRRAVPSVPPGRKDRVSETTVFHPSMQRSACRGPRVFTEWAGSIQSFR